MKSLKLSNKSQAHYFTWKEDSEVAKVMQTIRAKLIFKQWQLATLEAICQDLFHLKQLTDKNGNNSETHFHDFKLYGGHELIRAAVYKFASFKQPDLKAIMRAQNIYVLMSCKNKIQATKAMRDKLEDCILKVSDIMENLASHDLYTLSTLSDDDEFVATMMNWMEKHNLFPAISKRVQELLLTRNGLFPLQKFTALHSFVRRVIEGDIVVEFSSLARIFTLVIYFHGHNSFEETKKNLKLRLKLDRALLVNQASLIMIPNFINELVDNLHRKGHQIQSIVQLSEDVNFIASLGLLGSLFSNGPTQQNKVYLEEERILKKQSYIRYMEADEVLLKNSKLGEELFNHPLLNEALDLESFEHVPWDSFKSKDLPTYSLESKNNINLTIMSSNELEMMFLLSSMLQGHRRADINRSLSPKALTNMIEKFFDSINWGTDSSELLAALETQIGQKLPYHSDAGLKSQLIRLLHNFFLKESTTSQAYDSRKAMIHNQEMLLFLRQNLLIKRRVEILPFLTENAESFLHLKDFSRVFKRLYTLKSNDTFRRELNYGKNLVSQMKIEKTPKGLLRKISELYVAMCKKETNQKFITGYVLTIQFWLCCFFESFLKFSSHFHQLLVAKFGVLDACLMTILTNSQQAQSVAEFQHISILQSSFDLLSEIVKFNKRMFVTLEYLLTQEDISQLCDISIAHIVESNVFIRFTLVSNEYFKIKDNASIEPPSEEFETKSRILSYFEHHKNLVLFRIIEELDPDRIDRSNLSCINTFIIIFIFAKMKRTLLASIDEFMYGEYKDDKVRTEKSRRIRKLLDFWQCYYHQRSLDSRGLEATTRIQWILWQETVAEVKFHLKHFIE